MGSCSLDGLRTQFRRSRRWSVCLLRWIATALLEGLAVNSAATGLLVLFIFVFLIGILGHYLCVPLARRSLNVASKPGSVSRALWLCSCALASLLSWVFVIALIVLAVAFVIGSQWLGSKEGQFIGSVIVFAVVSSAVWDMIKRAPKAYWNRVKRSLDFSIPQSGVSRTCFNSEQSFLDSDDWEEKRRALDRVFKQCR